MYDLNTFKPLNLSYILLQELEIFFYFYFLFCFSSDVRSVHMWFLRTGKDGFYTNMLLLFIFFNNCHFLYSHLDQLPSFICKFSHIISQAVLFESIFLTFVSALTIAEQIRSLFIISYLDHCPGLVTPQSLPNYSTSYCQINLLKTLF